MGTQIESGVLFCRACTNECADFKPLHKRGLIFEEIRSLADLMEYCTNIEFPENESEMPQQLCSACVKSLIKAVEFKRMVTENDIFLRKGANSLAKLETIGKSEPNVDVENVEEDNVHEELIEHENENMEQNENMTMEKLSGKIEFITSELEEGNEFMALHYLGDGVVVDGESLHVQDADSDNVEMIPNQQDQYEIQYIDNDADTVDIVVDEIEDEYQEDIVEEYEESQSSMGQEVSGDEEVMGYLKEETTSVDGFSIESEQEESIEDPKIFFIDTRKRRHSDSESDAIQIDFQVNKKNPKFQCSVCLKQLSNAGSYKYHMQLHSDKTPYLCSLCGEGFKTRNAYDGHLSTHDPNNPNTCDICGKTYRQASSLRAHMVTHTGEKPFTCEICGKGLTQKSGYKKHMLTHTDVKPHACDICGREFRYSSNLLAHKRTHFSKKGEFRCLSCSKLFSSIDLLRKHKEVHSGETSYQCSSCPRKFKGFDALEAHRTTEHALFETKVSRSHIIEML